MNTNHFAHSIFASLIFTVSLFFIQEDGYAQEIIPDSKVVEMLRGIEHRSSSNRILLLRSASLNLNEIGNLLQSKLNSNDKEVQLCSAYLIGQYRFPEASELFVDNITLQDNRPQFAEKLWGWYPAMDALVKIGNPAIPFLITKLTNSDDTEVRALALEALSRIDNDVAITKFRLQVLISDQIDSPKMINLEAAIQKLKQKE